MQSWLYEDWDFYAKIHGDVFEETFVERKAWALETFAPEWSWNLWLDAMHLPRWFSEHVLYSIDEDKDGKATPQDFVDKITRVDLGHQGLTDTDIVGGLDEDSEWWRDMDFLTRAVFSSGSTNADWSVD